MPALSGLVARARRVDAVGLGLGVSLWLLLFCNASFWRKVWQAAGGFGAGDLAFLSGVFLVALLFVNFFLTLGVWPRLAKPWLILVLLVSAFAAYFMDTYGVVLDHTMIRNVFESDAREAGELLTAKLGAYVLVLGVLPSLWVAWVRIGWRAWWREAARKVVLVVASVCLLGMIAFVGYKEFASLLRNNTELKNLLNPTSYMGSVRKYAAQKLARPAVLEKVGEDARRGPAGASPGRKTVLAIVVGETARAANFSLGGYARPTNPELGKRRDLVYFTNVLACGTSTAVSLPCMFSDLGRAGYSEGRAINRESLLDVLARAGFDVKWRDNNSGCKGACARTGMEDLAAGTDPASCPHECFDAVLVNGLDQLVRAPGKDLVVVLHQKGSHGPSYYLRYPERFELFKPVCSTNQLETCTPQEIVNAYDNSIAYTDHILARTIELLGAQTDVDSALLYVSDHGESLGENGGVYLHGLPWAIAPDAQKHVPMLFWMSDGFQARFRVDPACLRRDAHQPRSHDNLFHSVLGLLDVQTAAYRAGLDLFRACRRGP